MELSDAVRRRRMVRSYDPDRDVPDDVLHRLVDLATRAPSAGFSQGWDFLILRQGALARFWQVSTEPGRPADRWLQGMRTAPVVVLCLSDPQRYLDRYAEPDKGWTDRDEGRWPVPYWDVDTGMAAMILLLGVVDAGLAGCFFGVAGDRHDAVRTAFAVPDDRRVVGAVTIGHPAPDRRSPSLRRGRRLLPEVAHDGRFGTPFVDQAQRGPAPSGPDEHGSPGRASSSR